jgi:hypothetical protein
MGVIGLSMGKNKYLVNINKSLVNYRSRPKFDDEKLKSPKVLSQ